jgi:imidazole glycerol phosphate synthase glutamine amidotransferase subunit
VTERPEAVIVRTGTANLASMAAGLRRAGARPRISDDPADVAAAALLVLPGVGTLAAAMGQLAADGRAALLRERVRARRPLLAVCLGLQLLCEGSQESPGVPGIGAVPGCATRFGAGVRVPQLGWNRVESGPGPGLLHGGHFYFANSYKLDAAPDGWRAALSDHGGPFVAAFEDGPVLACQFHPELSGEAGTSLLARWIDAAGRGRR